MLCFGKLFQLHLSLVDLDHCNSFFQNIAFKDITKFQRVQNCLAMVVTRDPRFTHSMAPLMFLH